MQNYMKPENSVTHQDDWGELTGGEWGLGQRGPGEWDARLLETGWGVPPSWGELQQGGWGDWKPVPKVSDDGMNNWLDEVTDSALKRIRQEVTQRRVRLMVYPDRYREHLPAPVIVKLSGSYLILQDLPAVRDHFGLGEDTLLDVWSTPGCSWRTVPASQPIYIAWEHNVVIRIHGGYCDRTFWREIRLCQEGTAALVDDPRAINMAD
ncbi:hypothetical protein NM688_g4680 [Phlebia brevispora]|uniref:Uncharacterized protein n=1 Tax=Phlebia brevispora TaxID=194682 RepID=A0ACC1T2F0_9APHY|nr:hypothetical protein NM688_g4680 [Phlebia brevispora]